jgi:hypothetical protein
LLTIHTSLDVGNGQYEPLYIATQPSPQVNYGSTYTQ